MSLFNKGIYSLFSGRASAWKIDCSAFQDDDWECLTNLVLERHPNFCHVHGVTTYGVELASRLSIYSTTGNILIVEDILNVEIMQNIRKWYRSRDEFHFKEVDGFVIFACMPCPKWVRALWQLDVRTDDWEEQKGAFNA